MTRKVRNRAALISAVLSVALGAAAQPAFEARTDWRESSLGNPVALCVGDFVDTGDGLLDFAATFDREDALGIFQNDGDGTFSLAVLREPPPPPSMGGPPEAESNIGVNPAALVAIDLDGDGIRDDIAGVNQDTNRFFAYENGGGTWLPADPEATRGGGLSATVGQWSSTALPGDACDDFFSATQNGRVNIAVSRCDGSGEFEIVAGFFRSGEVSVQTDIEVGDFVSLGGDDGQVDVLTLDNLNQQIVIWPGDPALDINLIVEDGMGNTALVFLPVEVGGTPVSPVQSIADDWNADGRLDLLVLAEQGYVLWYAGNGDPALGGFDAPLVTDLAGPLSPATRQPTRFTTMDYADLVGADGASGPDGIADLVIGDAGQASGTEEGFNWLWIVPGTGPNPPGTGPPTFDPAVQSKYAAPNLGALKPGSLTIDDFGAGLPDVLALGFDSSSWTVLSNDGAGGFDAAPSYAVGGTRARGLAARRLSGGPVDVVAVSRGEQTISELFGDGTGRLAEPAVLAESSGLGLASDLKVDDLDGDGVPDAVVTHATEHVLYRGLPGGGFASPEVLADGPLSLTGVSRLAELGGDSSPDLAIFDPALGNNTLGIWLGNGDGSFSLEQEIDGVLNYSTHSTGRFTSGTPLDAVLAAGETEPFSSPPALYLVSDDGSGNFAVTDVIGFPSPFDMFPSPVVLLVVGDFDGNGFDDAVAVLGGGESFFFSSDGTTLTPAAASFSIGGGPRAGVASDLNDDGRTDLAMATRNALVVFENQGSGFVGPPLVLPSNIDNAALLAVDLDGDDLPELISSSSRTNDVTVFRNVSVPAFRLRVGPDPTDTLCRISWPAVDGATFSFVRGNLTALWDDPALPLLDVTEIPCGLTASPDDFYDDAMPLPAAVPPYPPVAFYLVRCEGASCPEAGFGSDSMGMARYSNDPPDPCP